MRRMRRIAKANQKKERKPKKKQNGQCLSDPRLRGRKGRKTDTPIHAAASYNHIPLLRALVREHGGDANVTDHDGDTPLFVAETVETARCLVEELGADVDHRNESGLTVRVQVFSFFLAFFLAFFGGKWERGWRSRRKRRRADFDPPCRGLGR